MKKQILFLAALFIATAIIFTSCKKDDTTAPVVKLNSTTSSIRVILNSTTTDPGATATDDVDGAVTPTSNWATAVNLNLTGTYTVTYSATDKAGNVGTATLSVVVYNEAESLVGNYSVVDLVQGGSPSTYSDAITVSSTTNKKIIVQKFADYLNGTVSFTVDLTANTVTVPTQTVHCGTSPNDADRTFAGTGQISGTTITIGYIESTNGTSVTATETYTKQ